MTAPLTVEGLVDLMGRPGIGMTPEDALILDRNFNRVIRWIKEQEELPKDLVLILFNAAADYIPPTYEESLHD